MLFSSSPPHVIVLEVGSNDLCRPDVNCDHVVSEVDNFIDFLFAILADLRFVVVCEVIYRATVPYPSYNSVVSEYNTKLCSRLAGKPLVKVWHHRGFAILDQLDQNLLDDGVRLNATGLTKLFRSYRGAVMLGLSHM